MAHLSEQLHKLNSAVAMPTNKNTKFIGLVEDYSTNIYNKRTKQLKVHSGGIFDCYIFLEYLNCPYKIVFLLD